MSDFQTIAKLLTDIAILQNGIHEKFNELLIICNTVFFHESKPTATLHVISGNKKAD
jgi:hypothetical protein